MDAIKERMIAHTSILGVNVQHTSYPEVVEQVVARASCGRSGLVAFCNVHMAMTAYRDSAFRARINDFDIITPDGQPVRWAINLIADAGLKDRVYGPQTMLLVCKSAAKHHLRVFLYGSYEARTRRLVENLQRWYPTLSIVGYQPSRFRKATPEEDEQDISAIRRSGAQIVFVGMGCPLQENWAYEHRHSINAVQLCVGGAFDFHSGAIRQAPIWMQRNGLEWFFRFCMEPRRLWRRYLTSNLAYITLIMLQRLGLKRMKDYARPHV